MSRESTIRFLVTAVSGLLLVAGNAQSQDPDTADPSNRRSEDSQAVAWRTVTSSKYPITIRVPDGENWETQTAAGARQPSPSLCVGGGKIPEGLILTVHHDNRTIALSLKRIPETIILKDREDLRQYVDERLEQMRQAEDVDITIKSSELEETEGEVVYRLSFAGPLPGQKGPGGCGMQQPSQQAPAEEGDYMIVEHYIRPPGQNNVHLYRISSVVEQEREEEFAPIVQKSIDSFTFTSEKAESIFVPEADSSQLPAVKQQSGRKGPDIPWLALGAVIIAFVFMWQMRKRSKPGTG